MKNKPDNHSMKILGVISSCGGGDWPPLLALTEAMQQRGHDVTLICDAQTEPWVRFAGLTAVCLPVHLNLSDFFLPAIQRLLTNGENITPQTSNPIGEWADQSVGFIQKALGKWRPTLILGSLLCLDLGAKLAETFNIPWCFVNPAFHFGDHDSRPRKEDFSPLGGQMYEHWLLPKVCKASLILHATDPVFDDVHPPLPGNHFHTGPLFWEMPAPVPDYLGAPGAPWILLSLSTAPQIAEMELLDAALSALKDFNCRVLVTLSPQHAPIPSSTVPDNVFIQGYVPHSKVLNSCILAISHAGHGMVMKSIYHGIPMVLVPWGRDQPGVAARAHSLGVATVVLRKECNPNALARAIERTMNDPGIAHRSKTESRRLRKKDALSHTCNFLKIFFS